MAARPGDDEAQIRALVQRWFDASRQGDGPAVLELMSEDVQFLVPGRAPFGKAEFARAAEAQSQSGMQIDGRSEILELRVLGDWAYMVSKLQVAVTPAQGAPIRRSGHTLTLFRREAGGWKLARDANLLAPEADPPD
jgi:uncharacterized protein (TIGR02246 family)